MLDAAGARHPSARWGPKSFGIRCRTGGTAWIETSGIGRITRLEDAARWFAAHERGRGDYAAADPAYNVEVTQIVP
ncbi:MAG: hypothetical protein DMG07_05100 [Acidobacteria bacterium]|nr:MAG: hypothetical protein DMG07_05100 [Acidobacteriota bacterium]